MGSVVFVYSLSELDVSVASPVVNGLTFLITVLVSNLLGEKGLSRRFMQGTVFVVVGCYMMMK